MASNRIIIQPNGTGGVILGTYDVFGSNAGAETATVFDNTTAVFQGDFARGGDRINLAGPAIDYTIKIAGSNVVLHSTFDNMTVTIPIGTVGLTVGFENGANIFSDTRTLIFSGGAVHLGSQTVTSTDTAVDPLDSQSVSTRILSVDGGAITAADIQTGGSVAAASNDDASASTIPGGEIHLNSPGIVTAGSALVPAALALDAPTAEAIAPAHTDLDIFGTNAGAETVVVLDHTTAHFQGDFARGGDTIALAGHAADFTARLAGSNLVLTSESDDIVAYIPVGVAGLAVVFEGADGAGESRELHFDGAQVLLGSQHVSSADAALQQDDAAAVLAAMPVANAGAVIVLEHHAIA